MNLAYVKLDKPKDGLFNIIKYKLKYFLNWVYRDKYVKENYYITKLNDKSKNKVIGMLKRDKIDFIIEEKGIGLNYPTLKGNFALKYMLPEVIQYCFKLIHPKIEEVFICANTFSNENVQIIKDLSSYVKVVNIISENSRYLILEKQLENEGIYITINNNKRKSLKIANVVINLDFKDFKGYTTNRNMIIVDLSSNMKISKGFDGIYIKGIKIGTDKVMRVFGEYENFEKDELIEAEMLKINKYDLVRKYISMNKFVISEVIGERIINLDEFKRIEKMIG